MADVKFTPGGHLTDDQCNRILSLARNFGGGGFPLHPETGELMGWFDWLRMMVADPASPDLYEALKELRACIMETRGTNAFDAVFAADAALTKADGAAMEWSTDANGEGWFERDGEAAPTKTEEQSS